MTTNTPTEKATIILSEILKKDNPLDHILQLEDIDQWEVFQLLEVAKMLNNKIDNFHITNLSCSNNFEQFYKKK